MNAIITILVAALSIWDYPSRQPRHDQLRQQFTEAVRIGDTRTMEETCRKGVELLPDDPTWMYNLACALAYFPKRVEEALDTLEKAIDLGFRDDQQIAADTDLQRLKGNRRYLELIEYAKLMQSRPLMFGPLATVASSGVFGQSVSLGEQNLGWDFDLGAFVAQMEMAKGTVLDNTGDLYMNRDGGHSPNGPEALKSFLARHPGLTEVRLDSEGRNRHMDLNFPNIVFPYPVFGNSSMAFTDHKFWRSIPRAAMTVRQYQLAFAQKMYLSNQLWVFPSNQDTAPVGTNGDCFASIAPYWLVSAGRSFSDLPLVDAALYASAAFKKDVKAHLVNSGLLAPTIMTLMRKSLGVVTSEDEYTSSRAHMTAIPPNLVNTNRLVKAAKELTIAAIPPLAVIRVETPPLKEPPVQPELLYATAFSVSYILRSEEPVRTFRIKALGSREYRFVQTHGKDVKAEIRQIAADTAEITLPIAGLSPVNRVDIAVFGRNPGTGWGAPSYLSIARMDASAPYSDPALTLLPQE